jgi:hypothetical protein
MVAANSKETGPRKKATNLCRNHPPAQQLQPFPPAIHRGKSPKKKGGQNTNRSAISTNKQLVRSFLRDGQFSLRRLCSRPKTVKAAAVYQQSRAKWRLLINSNWFFVVGDTGYPT